MKWLFLLAIVCQARSEVCEPRQFGGAYGVQLSGTTTISGSEKPVALIGRLVFDGRGAVSGYVSVNYTGLLLGNPVNGTYDARTDCSLAWSLQDDSGAYQHFTGTMTSDFLRIEFHQTDQGGARQGLMVRTPQACSLAALSPGYQYNISGSTTAMLPGQTGRNVSHTGAIAVGQSGTVTLTNGTSPPRTGTIQVDQDCVTQMQLTMPSGAVMKLRGVLLDDGREILAIQTDPGATVTARFTAR